MSESTIDPHFFILLDSNSLFYQPGQFISGELHLNAEKPIKATQIFVQCKGRAVTKNMEPQKRHSSFQNGQVQVISTKCCPERSTPSRVDYIAHPDQICLWQSGPDRQLAAGKYKFPFCFELPLNCAPSWTGSFGSILYKCWAKLDIPFGRDKIARKIFKIEANEVDSKIDEIARNLALEKSINETLGIFGHKGRMTGKICLSTAKLSLVKANPISSPARLASQILSLTTGKTTFSGQNEHSNSSAIRVRMDLINSINRPLIRVQCTLLEVATYFWEKSNGGLQIRADALVIGIMASHVLGRIAAFVFEIPLQNEHFEELVEKRERRPIAKMDFPCRLEPNSNRIFEFDFCVPNGTQTVPTNSNWPPNIRVDHILEMKFVFEGTLADYSSICREFPIVVEIKPSMANPATPNCPKNNFNSPPPRPPPPRPPIPPRHQSLYPNILE